MTTPLVVGVGNPLRGDDGVGLVVARLVAADPRASGVRVLTRHQLVPELAEDVARASVAVVVDAHAGGEAPGTVAVAPVAGTAAIPGWSHHVAPAVLVALAGDVYGSAPDLFTVSIGGECFELGEGLSGAVAAALGTAVDAVVELVAVRTAAPAFPPDAGHD